MNFLKMAGERYSCRKFSNRPVEQEKINSILAAAGIAPTAHNYQPFRIYILKSESSLAKIREITKMTFNAPVVYVICTVPGEGWVNQFYDTFNSSELDVGIVITHMTLEAFDQGLGSLIACWFDPALVRDGFSIPDGEQPVALLSVGYPDEKAHPARLHYQRRDMREIVREL